MSKFSEVFRPTMDELTLIEVSRLQRAAIHKIREKLAQQQKGEDYNFCVYKYTNKKGVSYDS